MSAVLAGLRRRPDVEAPNLVAVDATDRLLLDLAEIDGAGTGMPTALPTVAVVDDRYGALTLGAVALGATQVQVVQDELIGELALAANAERLGMAGSYRQASLEAAQFAGVTTVLVQAPKSLGALAEIAQTIAAGADPDVRVLVGGRVKHMTTAMNGVLARSFTDVRPSLARQKSRVLVATNPLRGPLTFPERRWDADASMWICAHGGTFAGPKLDLGTRVLLDFVDRMAPHARTAVDLGCGTGVLAVHLARRRPELTVTASDPSHAAVRSCSATAAANAVSIDVRREVSMSSIAPHSVDLIVCNPPFHTGTTVQDTAAHPLFAAAGRALRPGGELWTVYNRHLDHGPALHRLVGATRIVGRTPKFTVAVSVRARG